MGDIEALQRARRGFEREGLAEQPQGFGARIGERLGGIGALEVAGFREGLAEGEDDIAELGGFFELLFFGGGEHFGAEGFEPFAGLAFEEGAGVVHAGAVGVGRDGVFETVEFLAHVVVELPGAVGAFLRGGIAEQNAELAAHLGERFAQESAVGEGAEIAGAIFLFKAGEAEAREFFGQIDADEEEAFVVGEVGVVFRFPLLDQLALEDEGLGFGLHFVHIEVGDHLDERANLRVPRHRA